MKSSDILWRARDRVDGKWAKGALRKKSGGACIIGAVNRVVSGNYGKYDLENFERVQAIAKLDHLASEQGFRSIEAFNDAPSTVKQDVLNLLEKAAIALEETGD